MAVTLDVIRLIHYAACMAVFGSSLFRVIEAKGRSDTTLRPAVVTASVVAALSAVFWLVLEAGNMAGDWALCLDRGTIMMVLDDTAFGHVWGWRLALILVLIVAARWADWWLVTVLGGGFLASLADEGHSTWIGGSAGALHLANQAIHLLAAGAWLGGLLPLWLLVGDRASSDVEAFRGVGLFSRVGYLAVTLVLATGAINTAILAQDGVLISPAPWSIALAIKLVLVAAMFSLAVINRLGIRRDGHRARLYRRIGIEIIIGILVLAAASVLGTLAPPQA